VRWRLAPGDWVREGQILKCGAVTIEITSGAAPLSLRISTAPESRYYQKRDELPVLEVMSERATTIISRFSF